MTTDIQTLLRLAADAEAALNEPDPAKDPRAAAFMSAMRPDVITALCNEILALRRIEETARQASRNLQMALANTTPETSKKSPVLVGVPSDPVANLNVVKAARMIYGITLTEAKKLVEGVRAGTPCTLSLDEEDALYFRKLGAVVEYR